MAESRPLQVRSLRDELAFLLDSTVDMPSRNYDRDTLLMRLETAFEVRAGECRAALRTAEQERDAALEQARAVLAGHWAAADPAFKAAITEQIGKALLRRAEAAEASAAVLREALEKAHFVIAGAAMNADDSPDLDLAVVEIGKVLAQGAAASTAYRERLRRERDAEILAELRDFDASDGFTGDSEFRGASVMRQLCIRRIRALAEGK